MSQQAKSTARERLYGQTPDITQFYPQIMQVSNFYLFICPELPRIYFCFTNRDFAHFCINAWSVVMVYTLPKMYEMLKVFYGLYKSYGYDEVAKELEMLMGDFSLTASEWIQQTMKASETVDITVGSVVYVYGIPAIGMSFLAFLVYKKLAKRNGNWERICSFVGNKKEDAPPIMTIPLMVGIAIGVLSMFFYELTLRMPR